MRVLVACGGCKRQYDASGRPANDRFHCTCGELVWVPGSSGHSAAVIRCSNCGAAREGDGEACTYCRASFTLHEQDLHTLCPQCAARVSDHAQYCHHCATPLVPEDTAGEGTEHPCPVCGSESRLVSRTLGREEDALSVLECGRCAGLWLGSNVFRVLQRRAREDAVPLDFASSEPAADADNAPSDVEGPFYRACPMCDGRMIRKNYAQRSGIIVDYCGRDGVWFDAGELHRVIAWLRAGGRGDPQAGSTSPGPRPIDYGRGNSIDTGPVEYTEYGLTDFVDRLVDLLSGW